MRLIDADDIRWCEQFDHDGNLRPYKIAYSDEMPPTIEAIPITFIEEKMEDIDTVFLKLLDRLEGRDAHKKLLHEYNALRNLIRAWEERREE